MEIFVLISCITIFFMMIASLFLITKYSYLAIKHKRIIKYLHKYLNTITSARYGNLNSKTEDGIDALTIQLSRNTNALLESIQDRDMMIGEYIEKEKQSQNIKQDFISSLAHDLKVPIIAQDNTYDLFLNGKLGTLSDNQISAIKNLKISNNDLKNLIINLLDAQKLDNQDYELNLETINISELIKEVINQNRSLLTIQNKIIHFNSTCENIYCKIDKFLIKRVLNNLISNAIFYGKKTQNIYIKLTQNKETIEIAITDEGSGINEENIKNIFKKYYTCAKKYSNIGAGLGLYIANKIILSHNGTLSARNNKNKGACFTINLPITKK